jgi:TRAP-type C4-dicarboxylate transport system permease small subunit
MMMQISIVLNALLLLLVIAYLGWDIYRGYKAADGNWFTRIVDGTKEAASSLWTGFTVIVTFGISGLAYMAKVVNAPAVAGALQQYGSPKVVAVVMVIAAVLVEVFRKKE